VCLDKGFADRQFFFQVSQKTGFDIAMLDPKGTTKVLLATTASEMRPEVSSDAQWLAYQSDVSGQTEVYVRPFTGDGPTEIVSRGAGGEPHWVGTRELICRRGSKVVSVPVAPSGERLNPGQEASSSTSTTIRTTSTCQLTGRSF
jgi:hypothetical protein